MSGVNRYWSTNYWNSNYWEDDFWGPGPLEVVAQLGTRTLTAQNPTVTTGVPGEYWNPNYWQDTPGNYWTDGYWYSNPISTGNVNAALAQLTLASPDPKARLEVTIRVNTPSLTVSPVRASTQISVSLGQLTLTGINPALSFLADVTTTVVPNAVIKYIDNAASTLGTKTLTGFNPGITESGSLTVSASLGQVDVSSQPLTVSNDTEAPIAEGTLSLTSYNTNVIVGEVINVLQTPGLSVASIAPTVVVPTDTNLNLDITPSRLVAPLSVTISATQPYGPLDQERYGPTNSLASEVASNYLICDRTGFRVPRNEGLKEEWLGFKVRKKSWEVRHPQDFIRGVNENQRGSQRPEQTPDRFIGTDVARVTVDDL